MQLVLDTKGLEVASVCASDGTELSWGLAPPVGEFGRALSVEIPEALGEPAVVVEYTTSPSATALQWLPPQQTGGKVHPFLFTQSQAIHARSFFPCQDTPQVKAVYEATVRVPGELTAIMSALGNGGAPVVLPDGRREFKFRQPVACASYLVALAVGDLQFREVGPRTGVWAEPGTVEAAAFEFAEMEDMLKAAEQVCGEYVWGEFTIAVARAVQH